MEQTPTILVIMGATGDLMKRKIIPSLWHLFEHNRLPKHFEIIGFARRDWTDAQFQDEVNKTLDTHEYLKKQPDQLKRFLDLFSYQQGTFDEPTSYTDLHKKIEAIESEWRVCTNKLFYFAVAPTFFETIFKGLASVGLHEACGGPNGWTRVLVEKPFGSDQASAERLEKMLALYFKEEQIYRLDHYLGKELVQSIRHFRFSNNLLEKSWNNRTIERIELRLLETLDVEKRGSFYDKVGALRDMGQNHLLELLAMVTMDVPEGTSAEQLRSERSTLLKTLQPWTPDHLKYNTYRAQHTGYTDITGVDPHSTTETYFRLKTELLHPAWRGVPIIIESGKRCHETRKEIVVTFKHPSPCVNCTAERHITNTVTFSLPPEDQISIRFWTKKPGFDTGLEERSFSFFVNQNQNGAPYVQEYAQLMDASIRGDQSIFVSHDEVLAAWRFTDPIIEAWKNNVVPLVSYEPGSTKVLTEAEKYISPLRPDGLEKTIGLVGLGKMGGNLARHLLERDWKVVGYNRSPEVTKSMANEGLTGVFSIPKLLKTLPKRKIVWIMVTAGDAVDTFLFGDGGLVEQLHKGDIIIDGGNSFYTDTIKRAERLAKYGIHYLDVGTSGGPGGARTGACLMIGGEEEIFNELESLFRDVSNGSSYRFFPGHGAGHFVKMVHNGIEYGMMQAIAEGFEILKKVDYNLNLTEVVEIYNNGSVIESRLTEWLEKAFILHGQDLSDVTSTVAHTGEGAWTVETAKVLKVAAPIIAGSLDFRKESAEKPSYTGQVLSALREQFGGHAAKK